MGVERRAVQRLHPLGVHLPQHPVVGHARRKRPARPRQRRVVRRRKEDPAWNATSTYGMPTCLGHRAHARRHQAGRHQRIASLGAAADAPRTARRPTRLRPAGHPPASTASCVVLRAQARAPTGRAAPSARRHGPAAPRSPAARTPAPPRRAPATAPRAPPAVRRLRATPTSTTTHAFRYPHFRRFWLRPAILRHDRGLAASPPMRYMLKVEGSR